MKTASDNWHAFLKQLTSVSLVLPVSYRTQMCINSGLLKPGTICSLRALFKIYSLKHQIHFLGRLCQRLCGHITSVLANRLSNEYQFGPCWFPANCQYFKPNSSISKWIDDKWKCRGWTWKEGWRSGRWRFHLSGLHPTYDIILLWFHRFATLK